MTRRDYLAGLDAALHGVGLPYGYTITIWSSGQILIGLRGTPTVWLVLLFAAGAVAAYGSLKWTSRRADAAISPQFAADEHLLRDGIVHVAAIGAALGCVALMALIPSAVTWPLGGLVATAVYLCVAGVELGLRERAARAGGG